MIINSEEYSQEMQCESPLFPEFLHQVQFRVNNPQRIHQRRESVWGYSTYKVNPINLT